MASHVKFPGSRRDLIYYIGKLADFEMQKREWVKSDHPCWFWANADYPIDMLLDEGDLNKKEYATGKIGYWFRNEREALAAHRVGILLKRVIDEVGIKKPDSIYLTSPLWQEVVQAAKEAYEILMEDEDLDELLRQENARSV